MLAFLTSFASSRANVNVMAPLGLFDDNNNLKDQGKFTYYLDKLRDAQVDGVMIDVWWGYTEKNEKQYDFHGYEKAFQLITERNMKIIPVFSFHRCGGSVGDDVNIALPSFVHSGKPWFVDGDGRTDDAYISFAYDEVKVSPSGRTPLEMYRDWMTAFNEKFGSWISQGKISEIELGLGPCGELRYPSYQDPKGWSYPGCGEFQAYDVEFTKLLKKDAIAAGKADFAHHPTNVGGYNTRPGGSEFWRDDASNGFNTEYGKWYIKWYAEKMNEHASRVMKVFREIYPTAKFSSKIAGLHWWYMTSSHCAETTAGFNNFYNYDGYRDMITVFKEFNCDVCFTCLEMLAGDNGSNPPALVSQIIRDTHWAGLNFEGENALAIYDWDNYMRCKNWVSQGLKEFTLLRMCDNLFWDNNYNTFKGFVQQMHY